MFASRSHTVSLAHALAGAFALVCAALVAFAVWSLTQSRQSYVYNAEVALRNLAYSLESGVSARFERADLTLLATVDAVQAWQADAQRQDPVLDAWLQRQAERVPGLDVLYVTDAQGRLRHGKGVDRQARVSIADRDYFAQARDNPNAGLLVSEPVFGKLTGRAQLVLAQFGCHAYQGYLFGRPMALDAFEQWVQRA